MTVWAAVPLSLCAAAAVTERGALVASRVARLTGFMDWPVGYKGHRSPTPYLGGAAVIAAVLLAWIAFGASGRLATIAAGTVLLCLVGTVDDRVNLAPQWRILAEVGVAGLLWGADLGVTAFGAAVPDLAATVFWVVAAVNAFNLMDNIDGACASIAGISAAGLAAAALAYGQPSAAIMAVAVSGGCLGFLRHNLAAPARIFLGDGGSMPLGFLVAGLSIAVTRGRAIGPPELVACVLFAGLPVLDTTLVMISRYRRGANLITGGRDHLTHRLLTRLRTPRRVTLTLACVQAALVTLVALALRIGPEAVVGLAGALALPATAALMLLESPPWAPPSPGPALTERPSEPAAPFTVDIA
ncbi:MAG: undecaprenyl/decaprenyl-phosphate alpha-N-acetylglucosaminyl 1-phosphate transferase [Solirubrobacterales bacterium]|nr:undecaprenyl/decaprenyl-phosphate alpha-N-acetylglucosaminyl 1-phosphate transferase [Solirubrobacterales bacterium]MBV9474265.1 undecaprenyl/decaprenyl-phosphate alpha-N-acetylglucosaminyl 1-phosphate transferase [Solirubrobacterales bacterium]